MVTLYLFINMMSNNLFLKEKIENDLDFQDILISKQAFYGILNKSMAPFAEKIRIKYRDSLMHEIINQYKYGILSFVLCLKTVKNIDDFIDEYLPSKLR